MGTKVFAPRIPASTTPRTDGRNGPARKPNKRGSAAVWPRAIFENTSPSAVTCPFVTQFLFAWDPAQPVPREPVCVGDKSVSTTVSGVPGPEGLPRAHGASDEFWYCRRQAQVTRYVWRNGEHQSGVAWPDQTRGQIVAGLWTESQAVWPLLCHEFIRYEVWKYRNESASKRAVRVVNHL